MEATSYKATACDFCNCLLGINPYYTTSNLLAVRALFQHSEYIPAESTSGFDRVVLPEEKSSGAQLLHQGHATQSPYNEHRITYELAYQHHFSEHFMATVTLPLIQTSVTSESSLKTRGIGDMTLLGHYATMNNAPNSLPYVVMAGVGIKLPTGANNLHDDNHIRLPHDYQPGSGSVGILANLRGTLQLHSWTLGADMLGTINTMNSFGDQHGNSIAFGTSVNRDVYRDNEAAFAVVGIAGGRLEATGKGKTTGTVDANTSSTAAYAQLGAEIRYSSFGVECVMLAPVLQHREANAPDEKTRWSVGLRYEL